jgi:3-hydroxyisobutyrate dehydrogenase and related beta-hydroxyacid dehydrogenases
MIQSSTLRVGFIGIGDQGGGIVERICRAGFPTRIWARRREAVIPFEAIGAEAANTIADLGECDIIGLCVRDDAGVIEIMDALLPSLRPHAIVVIFSTVHPDTCIALGARAAEHEIALIDAPVSGGGDVARSGNLSVMIGGSADIIAYCRPVLESFAGMIVHLGPLGSGQYAKLINNALLTAHLALADEALAAGSSLGLDRAALAELLLASSGRSYAIELIDYFHTPKGFPGTDLLRKDVGLLSALVGERAIDASALISTGQLFLKASNHD